jgi:biopolymer transport protein ExbD
MAHDLGTSRKGSVNIELNLVPFVDVMSCLTAFLLVTAVWLDVAHLRDEPAGRGRDVTEPHPRVTVLLQHDQIVLTALPSGETQQFPAHDWTNLEAAMKRLPFDERPHVEIAADSTAAHPIPYQTLIAAMDSAIHAGYPDVGVTDPASLSRE